VFERRNASIRSTTIPEVVISEGAQRFSLICDFTGRPAADAADSDAGHARPWPRREKKFVIFTIVQRLLDRCAGENRDRLESGRYSRCRAQPAHIGGKAIADIHAGCGFAEEPASERELRPGFGFVPPSPQRAGYIHDIAGVSAIAAKRFSLR